MDDNHQLISQNLDRQRRDRRRKRRKARETNENELDDSDTKTNGSGPIDETEVSVTEDDEAKRNKI